jgi:hypothetical protein
MKTTLDIDAKVLSDYERLSSEAHRSLSQVIEDDLRESLARRDAESRRQVFEFSEFKDVGLHGGANPHGYVFFDRMDEAEFEAFYLADD